MSASSQPGGVHVVRAGDPDYGPVLGRIVDKTYTFLGESYASGTREVLYRVPGGRQKNPSIGIGREFFVTALRDYDDWQLKWWREAIQNAVDAGATNIQLVTKDEGGEVVVSCEDNGGGMSPEVLLDKFLVLGGTTKATSSGSAGGFGKAKELLLLPWLSWEVHTRAKIARGTGIEYEVVDGEHLRGTRITVRMPADQATHEAAALAFLEKCDLPGVRFTVNGKPVKANLKAAHVIRTVDDKAVIAFEPAKKDAPTSYRLMVRTKGLFMFDMYLGEEVAGDVIVELLVPSIGVLTANRDGFRDYGLKSAIEKFAREVVVDVRSALRKKRGLIEQVFRGTGRFQAAEAEAEVLRAVGPVGDASATDTLAEVAALVATDAYDRRGSSDVVRLAPVSAAIAKAMLEIAATPNTIENQLKQLVWQPDFFVRNRVEGFRVPKEFFPETMSPRVAKLAGVWAELCRFVLLQLGSRAEYGVGFVFDEDVGAEYSRHENENWLLLNPFRDARHQKHLFRPTVDEDLQWLYAAAIHEVTHLADGIQYHNESFASALTRNVARCAKGWKRVAKIAKLVGMPKRAEVAARASNPVGDLREQNPADIIDLEARRRRRPIRLEEVDVPWDDKSILRTFDPNAVREDLRAALRAIGYPKPEIERAWSKIEPGSKRGRNRDAFEAILGWVVADVGARLGPARRGNPAPSWRGKKVVPFGPYARRRVAAPVGKAIYDVVDAWLPALIDDDTVQTITQAAYALGDGRADERW